MNTPVLNDNLRAATEALCNLLAKEDKVVASKAKIGLFFQNPEATKLFEEVNAYGEELRNKHLAGMPPTEEEISKFDALRENVIKNDAARGFLEARQTIDELLNTINHYLGMSIDLLHLFIERHIFDAPMFAQHRHLAPSLLRQNRQDA